MKSALRILILICFVPALGWGQFTLRGQIRNGADDTPLPFTNVFLANTTRGTTSDEQGNFVLTNLPGGRFELVASHVGFLTLKVAVQTQEQRTYRLSLKPDEKSLAEVTVRARSRRGPDWARKVEVFKNYFIGQTENAGQCRLLNPDALYFENVTDQIIARAYEPLQIENQALGYLIKFQLEGFSYDSLAQRVVYEGDAVYEPLAAGSARVKERWQENRLRAYHGSIMHFMRSLFQNKLFQEGFVFQKLVERKKRDGTIERYGLTGDTTVTALLLYGKRAIPYTTLFQKRLLDTLRSTPAQPILRFDGLIHITYTREGEPYDYQRTRRTQPTGLRIPPQSSYMRLVKPEVVVERDGQFFDPKGIRWEGYWSWELLADQLPFDYEPGTNVP